MVSIGNATLSALALDVGYLYNIKADLQVSADAAALAGASALTGASVASAKALPPVAVTCNLTDSVTFAKPGLSYNGTLGKKSTSTSLTANTATGTGWPPKSRAMPS